MAAPRKYPDELRARAIRMVREKNERGAIKRVADQLGINPETLRNWVRQAQVDDGERAGTPSDLAEENRQLRQQLAEAERPTRSSRPPPRSSRGNSTDRSGDDPLPRRPSRPVRS